MAYLYFQQEISFCDKRSLRAPIGTFGVAMEDVNSTNRLMFAAVLALFFLVVVTTFCACTKSVAPNKMPPAQAQDAGPVELDADVDATPTMSISFMFEGQ